MSYRDERPLWARELMQPVANRLIRDLFAFFMLGLPLVLGVYFIVKFIVDVAQ